MITFRVDASAKIGLGHLSRCLTLATGLALRGAGIRFICADLPDNLADTIQKSGFAVDVVPMTSLREDAERTIALLKASGSECLILDHYGLGLEWEEQVKRGVRSLVVIEDLPDRTHACDVLLDSGCAPEASSRYQNRVPASCQLFLGPQFALLREEFSRFRPADNRERGPLRNVAIAFGGVDFTRESFKVLAAIEKNSGTLSFDLFTSSLNPALEELRGKVATLSNVTLHVDSQEMAKHLSSADLAIGAGGISAWERCCLGVPTLLICTADNQRENCHFLSKTGAARFLGDSASITPSDIARALEDAKDPNWRRSSAEVARSLCDGRGVARVAKALLPVSITMRRAQALDEDMILSWRNHDTVRSFMFNTEVIAVEDHRQWFRNMLGDTTQVFLIGESPGLGPVGVVKFNLSPDNEEAFVGIYLAPHRLGSGIGATLLQTAEEWFLKDGPKVKRFRAEVKETNVPSLRLFEKCGYEGTRGKFLKRVVLS